MSLARLLARRTRGEVPLLIAFADLTRYTAETQRVPDAALAAVMDTFYERVAARVKDGGGAVVKYIGDAAFVVFPEPALDRGVVALLALKDEVDEYFSGLGWECRLIVRAHFGVAVAGPYGGAKAKRFDVLGKAVNAAARLAATGVTCSPELLGRLSPAVRRRYQQHGR